ncbi:MAG: cob(I)yrinic acid a,c-diamide adenosyltransferase [Patescibacteria group bacterium]
MAIYTRTGDKGKTSLFDGKRVLKSDKRVETYGTIDELNSSLGMVLAHMGDSTWEMANDVRRELEQIQHDLFAIGSALATPYPLPVVGLETRPAAFEKLIDVMTDTLPELKQFILPGGSLSGASLHISRSITRRAERQLVSLMQEEEIDPAIIKYVNRLSDLLFTMARLVNQQEKQPEITWKKR